MSTGVVRVVILERFDDPVVRQPDMARWVLYGALNIFYSAALLLTGLHKNYHFIPDLSGYYRIITGL